MSPYIPGSSDPSVPGVTDVWTRPTGFTGYDQASQANHPPADGSVNDDFGHSASGSFKRGNGAEIALWITDLTADFAVSGVTGQSRLRREYFPHSFNDVTLTITGNVASTQEYNRLALFVREHSYLGLAEVDRPTDPTKLVDQSITFTLHPSTTSAGRRRAGASVPDNQGVGSLGSNIKGPYRGWEVQGFIRSMAAGAQAHEVAPEFKISFIVMGSYNKANTGIWGDAIVAEDGQVLSSFAHLLRIANSNQRVQGKEFISDPYAATPTGKPQPPGPTRAGVQDVSSWVDAAVSQVIGGFEDALGLIPTTGHGALP